MLRSVNLIFALANAYILHALNCRLDRRTVTTRTAQIHLLLSSLSLVTFPLLFFFNFLYYTDPGSLFFVLLMYFLHLNRHDWMAGLAGAVSLLFRQTNIVWLFWITAYNPLQLLVSDFDKLKKRDTRMRFLLSVLEIAVEMAVYVTAGILFLVFVFVNRGESVLDETSPHE